MPRSRRQERAVLALVRADYDKMLRAQGGRCALCPTKPKTRRLDIDHDHRSLQIRGLLCHRCNRALASWVTPSWLRTAALYLEHSERKAAEAEARAAQREAALKSRGGGTEAAA